MQKYNKMLQRFLFLGIFLNFSLKSLANSTTYVGAVVQYEAILEGINSDNIVEANAFNFRQIAKYASKFNVDIIVFPEQGLTPVPQENIIKIKKPPDAVKYDFEHPVPDENLESYVKMYRSYYRDAAVVIPNPKEAISFCESNDPSVRSLAQLSCAAHKYSIYIIANHYERVDCNTSLTSCPSDGFFLYSTSVAFDRSGRLIARQRQHGSLIEPWLDVPTERELASFTTDFNVTFGLLVGAADLFDPWLGQAIKKRVDITDVALTAREVDLPFLFTGWDRRAWFEEVKVNLLAAGSCWDVGPGIYVRSEKSFEKFKVHENPTYMLYKDITKIVDRNFSEDVVENDNIKEYTFKEAEVPAFDSTEKSHNLRSGNWNFKDFSSENSIAYYMMHPDEKRVTKQLCVSELCCSFIILKNYNETLAYSNSSALIYRYALITLRDTYRLRNGTVVGIELCVMAACKTDLLSSCGEFPPPSSNVVYPTTFKEVIITRDANTSRLTNHYVPTAFYFTGETSTSDFFFKHGQPDEFEHLIIYLHERRKNIFIFGLNGRLFGLNDSTWFKPSLPTDTPVEDGAGASMWFVVALLLIAMVIAGLVVIFAVYLRNRHNDAARLVYPVNPVRYCPASTREPRKHSKEYLLAEKMGVEFDDFSKDKRGASGVSKDETVSEVLKDKEGPSEDLKDEDLVRLD